MNQVDRAIRWLAGALAAFLVGLILCQGAYLLYCPVVRPRSNRPIISGQLVNAGAQIMVNGQNYLCQAAPAAVAPSLLEISGWILSSTYDMSQPPERNNQSNFGLTWAPYARLDGTIYVYTGGSWFPCSPVAG